ncbi:helix-turn-helix domain-containing protein [Paenibacillus sp. MMS20-IR301]|uniref:helix-turn-helix domain-containing protein n=1 Tax=Paenibacillus sp. MMS20-IR301 TaxID=2895946 RepID=UPI0028EDDEE4|nr:helix-turn-helix domain-containing protein [Paenibacillus sp. MMS20-IR301]WNS41958.1 helix-turn-helix domain-containing protein [Paenibacillus sp. MMS20-IR301]
MKKAIAIIEERLGEDVSVEQIAGECYVSPRQLYRDFYSLTGHPVYEYIRRRRLSKALHLIKYSDMEPASVVYACGYSSQAAFCRTVKALLNMTPTAYKAGTVHYYFPVFNTAMPMQVEVKTVRIPSMIAVHYFGNQLAGIEDRAVQALLSILPQYNGLLLGRNEKQAGKRFCYELQVEYCRETLERVRGSQGLAIHRITPPVEQLYATTIVNNAEADINQAWNYLYSHWMKISMFEQENLPYFEAYVLRKGKIRRLVLHLPIRLSADYPAISIQTCPDRLFLIAAQRGSHAEKAAAEVLTEFLAKQYPYLLETQKEYYVSGGHDCCTCGIVLHEHRYVPDDGSISVLEVPGGLYAVLEGTSQGNRRGEEAVLAGWVEEHGLNRESRAQVFTVFDASGGTGHGHIGMKSYIKLADNDNTAGGIQTTIRVCSINTVEERVR